MRTFDGMFNDVVFELADRLTLLHMVNRNLRAYRSTRTEIGLVNMELAVIMKVQSLAIEAVLAESFPAN